MTTIAATSDDDIPYGTGSDYTIGGGAGNEEIYAYSGVDTHISGGLRAAMTTITGTSGDDILYGTDYEDTIIGGAGNDTLYAYGGNDTLIGGLGNDIMRGGSGSDTYIYSLGDGNDLILESYGTGVDTLQLVGINPSDISLAAATNDYDDLIITIKATGETIRIDEQLSATSTPDYSIDRIAFADGTVWDLATINSSAAYLGTAGDDTIWGNGFNNTFIGGLGNDSIRGYGGSDTYIYAAGDGNDTIYENYGTGTDTLRLDGINPGDITLTAATNDYDDLIITINATGETIRIDEQLSSTTSPNYSIDQFAFADGTTWDLATINASPIYLGTAGNDTIWGNAYNNTIEGGTGNDTMRGNAGNDTFVFKPGFGHDTISDFSAGAAEGDVIRLEGLGFTSFDDVLAHAQQSGNDTVIEVDSINSITLTGVSLSSLHENDFAFC